MAVFHSPTTKGTPPRQGLDSGEEPSISPRSRQEVRDWHEKILDAVGQKVQYLLSQGTSRASSKQLFEAEGTIRILLTDYEDRFGAPWTISPSDKESLQTRITKNAEELADLTSRQAELDKTGRAHQSHIKEQVLFYSALFKEVTGADFNFPREIVSIEPEKDKEPGKGKESEKEKEQQASPLWFESV